MSTGDETPEGYVVDIACLRKWSQQELPERARAHTRQCSLEGHCLESGFGLVDDLGRTALLDTSATLKVIEAVKRSPRDSGIRLRAVREEQDGELKAARVEEVSGAP